MTPATPLELLIMAELSDHSPCLTQRKTTYGMEECIQGRSNDVLWHLRRGRSTSLPRQISLILPGWPRELFTELTIPQDRFHYLGWARSPDKQCARRIAQQIRDLLISVRR